VKPVDEKTVRLELEFDGANYFGWQLQPNRPTVQSALEKSLARLYGAQVRAIGAGRTDTGVSALNYTVSFRPPRAFAPGIIIAALNQSLPQGIVVRRARLARPDFHARYSARSRSYRYTIVTARSPLLSRHAWEVFRPLDIALMTRAAKLFLGEHDYAPFCHLRTVRGHDSAQNPGLSQDSAPGRVNVLKTVLRRSRDRLTGLPLVQFEVEADHFLYKLVRRMAGALVDVGLGRYTLADVETAIRRRPLVQFSTAPACGLLFLRARY
jgi:tRNA pseudouridine38-40 synthase